MKVTEYEIDQWITKYLYEQKSAINTVQVGAMEHKKNTIRKYCIHEMFFAELQCNVITCHTSP